RVAPPSPVQQGGKGLSRRNLPACNGNAPDVTSLLQPLGDDRPFRHHDDAAADVKAVEVAVLDALVVDQPHAIGDARVLVDDDAVERDVATDAEPHVSADVTIVVAVGSQQHRAQHARSFANAGPDAHDRFLDGTGVQVA